MSKCPADCTNCEVPQAYGPEIFTADGVFIKQMVVPKAQSLIPQHSHRYDHTSMLAKGSVILYSDEMQPVVYTAPSGIFIKARVKHSFITLEDETIIYCIHRNRGLGAEVLEEHKARAL